MPKARVALLAMMVPLALLAAAFSQETTSSGSPLQTVSGQVMTAYDDSLVIETEAGEERAFVMDSNVKVPTEASPGRWVTVTYRSPGGARAFAVGVNLDDDETPLPAQLPRTASPLSLLALMGLTALAASTLLRAAVRRVD